VSALRTAIAGLLRFGSTRPLVQLINVIVGIEVFYQRRLFVLRCLGPAGFSLISIRGLIDPGAAVSPGRLTRPSHHVMSCRFSGSRSFLPPSFPDAPGLTPTRRGAIAPTTKLRWY